MLHTWLSHLDSQNKRIRICFLDFSKAFDRIGCNILIEKLIDLVIRRFRHLVICSQRTKLGPILFLVMINDLKISSPDTKMWKFVDDSTVSEHLTGNISSVTQLTLNLIESWCSNNWMVLNPIKCKELRICYAN